MANKKNLAAGIVANSPGTSGTSLVLETGYGQTMPAVPFFLTLTPAGQLSTTGNSEIVEVTAVATDTLTMVRGQRGTTAKNIAAGWVAVNGVYTEDMTPVGVISAYAAATAPTGYLICDGGEYNSDDYPDLFAVIGNTYGGTAPLFNVPNLQQKFPLGGTNLGTTGGEAEHTLTVDEMPRLYHDHREARDFGAPLVTWPFNAYMTDMADSGSGVPVMRLDGAQGTGIIEALNTANAGGGAAHNNMPPYQVVNYIIKAQ